jgi:16S rRNA processing protein RimM
MLLVVGQIGKPHGIRGEVLVTVRTDEPEARFVPGTVFTTEAPTGTAAGTVPEKLSLEAIRWHQGRGIAVFDGVPDRNAADLLRGVLLQIDSESVAPSGDPDEFHDHQLVGLAVVAVDGTAVGTVQAIEHGPASDLIVLRKSAGGTARIPFVSVLVPAVDLGGGRIVVDLPEGLLDL